MALCVFSANSFAQNSDRSPFKTTPTIGNTSEAMWDVLFNYNIQTFTSAGNAGLEFDGNSFWITKWSAGGASNVMLRMNKDGSKRDSFSVGGYTGASGIRDLAWDGKYIYGGLATGPNIVRIDTGTKAVVKTIVTSVGAGNVRAIAWDPGRNGFWVCGFAGNIFCVDTNGTTIATITNTLAGKYGLAYDNDPVGGPMLYVWDQGAGANTPQIITQISLTTMANTGVTFNVSTVITDAAGIAGGLCISSQIVPGKVVIAGCWQGVPDRVFGLELRNVGNPLSAFNLQTPSAGARVVTAAGSSTPVTITWDTSATGASYKFIFGNPTLPTRRMTIPSTVNSITTTLGALDAILAANGFTNNGSASDSAVGQWDVWAFKAPGVVGGADSMKATNGPRAITFRRQQVSLTPFALTAPAAGTSITTSPVNSSTISITWGASGSGATYRWLFKNAATYSDPAYLRVVSDGLGFTNSLTLRNSQLDSMLAAAGLAAGDSIVGIWRVRAYTTTDSLNSTAPDRSLTLRRASLLPLDQRFTETTFPPAFWTYTFTGTQYWSRQAPGGYGASVGSAMYDYYSAPAGNTQTLTSNQFPAVTAPNNYLRFNYAQKFYQPTTTLSADSMGIFTSTDAGTTWVKLITLKATNTPQLGYNSHSNLTTTGAIGNNTEYMLPANNEWATKILLMPAGTNKVQFTAWSAFGNNAFIDDITSGPVTGTGNQLTLTPDKYELSQNYPNPFNPTTKINFSLPKAGFVTLKVYDMLGKEVAQLVNADLAANSYSVDFNGANLASGMYFYKLEATGFTDVKRMMLIK